MRKRRMNTQAQWDLLATVWAREIGRNIAEEAATEFVGDYDEIVRQEIDWLLEDIFK